MLRKFTRSVAGVLAAVFSLLGGNSQPANAQTTSLPGAVSLNGDFYVLKEEGIHLRVWQWNNTSNTWHRPLGSLIPGTSRYGIGVDSRPAARTLTGGFHAIIKQKYNFHGGFTPKLIRWEAPFTQRRQLTWLSPTNTTTLSEPAGPIFNRQVYTVAGMQNARSDSLLEANTESINWTDHGRQSTAGRPSRHSPVCILSPTQYFMAAWNGHLVERWHTGSAWAWGDHGKPASRVNAVHVGAPMPATRKFFVTCDNGSLWQRWWNGSGWRWHNHGIPFGWRVDSPAVATEDGKLFVTGDWDHSGGNTRVLLQLYYANGAWHWYSHHTPPNTSVAEGGPAAAFGGHHVVVKGTNGRFYICYWNGSAWAWEDCGSPP